MKTRIMSALTFTMLSVGAAASLQAQGCCGAGNIQHAGCGAATGAAGSGGGHDGHTSAPAAQAPAATPSTASPKGLAASVKPVFDGYCKVQRALAQDSLEGVAEAAAVIAASVRGDPAKVFSGQIAVQAEALAKAKDLVKAREAFKPLSLSLVAYLKASPVPAGSYHEVYCSMAKASWLQTEQAVANPYFGKAMLRCGQFKS